MKKIASFLLSLALLLSFVTSVHAESKPLSILIGDEKVQFGANQTIIEKGTTLIAAKPLLEKLKFKVTWNQTNKVITGSKDGLNVNFQIGNVIAVVNSIQEEMNAAPKLIKGTAYLPLRSASEVSGYEVKWNQKLNTISIIAKEASRGFLWKVESADSTVYLLGSIHIASKAMYPLRSEIQQAFKASDYLVVEADITKMDDEKVQQAILDMSTYKDGTTLKDHISEDVYKEVAEILKENGAEPNALDAFKPWSVSSALDYLTSMYSDYDSSIGIDMHFLQQAIANQLPILELESVDFQLQMFDKFSARLQEEMVIGSIENYYSTEAPIDGLTEMWVKGNDDDLLALTKATATDQEYYNVLLKDRNIGMVDKITGYLNNEEKKTYFVVAGAAHMIGDDGIVTLLEKKGFKVVRQ
ncbi:hypothetical protein FHS15_004070 [Paenibacillus castaneae]|uniref:TraB/GumN family protein n=1 Tax=Paenibacillus castaneae TaxID=474957 RepID=UPI000C9A37F1|nr:TraB/GumN family protein [Paenibacillus castaneae]NIK78924.1 hypothetical protein [Paenibacillus castaneae]